MGAARTITSIPRVEAEELWRDFELISEDGEVQPLEFARFQKRFQRLRSALAVADGRMHAIRLLSGDVSDVRNIEAKCAQANITPLIFDLDPSPEAA
jgi:hypothetical protein